MDIKKLITDLQVCADDDILCTACDRYYEMKEKGGTADCVNKLLLDAAEALEKMSRWIPVTERLPEKDYEDVLAFDEICGCFITFMKTTRTGKRYFAIGNGDATHWMPLPEPPNEDSL